MTVLPTPLPTTYFPLSPFGHFAREAFKSNKNKIKKRKFPETFRAQA